MFVLKKKFVFKLRKYFVVIGRIEGNLFNLSATLAVFNRSKKVFLLSLGMLLWFYCIIRSQ